jgi:hypothetical protein
MDGLVEFGKEVIEENTKRIPMRLDPYGNRQKENQIATYRGRIGYKETKRKRLGHAIPLWGKEEILKNPNAYRIVRTGNLQVTLSPPQQRRRVIIFVRQKGYVYWLIPNVVKGEQPSLRLRKLISAKLMAR